MGMFSIIALNLLNSLQDYNHQNASLDKSRHFYNNTMICFHSSIQMRFLSTPYTILTKNVSIGSCFPEVRAFLVLLSRLMKYLGLYLQNYLTTPPLNNPLPGA